MALQGPIPVEFGLVFPDGVYAAGGFEPVRDFDASTNGRFVQSKDKASGLPLWQVEVIDADATARTRTVKMKVAAQVQLSMPLARDVVKDLAVEHGACVRPIQLRRTDLATGQTEPVLVPCGHTLASVCPSCAERAKNLRAAQCREGWHLDREPVIEPDDPTDEQKWWIETRADAQAARDADEASGEDITGWDDELAELDEQINEAGMRGNVLPARHRTAAPLDQAAAGCPTPSQAGRRPPNGRQDLHHAGRQDVPAFAVHHAHLPVIRARQGRRYAGRSRYLRLHRGRRATRCTSPRSSTGSCRTCAGSSATTCSTSPRSSHSDGSRRTSTSPCAAPSPGPNSAKSSPRPITRCGGRPPTRFASTAATCPSGTRAPRAYLDPATGEVLPTWDEALDAIGDQDEPLHVARFGDRFDAQGVLAGSKDASRCIGYLTKYLTKHVGDCHRADTDDQVRHADRLADALRYEPCSPTCANWLRYGVQPKNAKPGMRPGGCKGKAHRREYLGYAGRRVLVSRKWSGKTLADHRADRKNWLMEKLLGLSATDSARYAWEPVAPGDRDHMPTAQRMLHVVADRIRWQQALDEAAEDEPRGNLRKIFRQQGGRHDNRTARDPQRRVFQEGAPTSDPPSRKRRSCLASAEPLPTASRVRATFPPSDLADVSTSSRPSSASSSTWRTKPHERPCLQAR